MAYKTVTIDGKEVPVLPAEVQTTIKNKITGQVYASLDEFNADVADPNTDTKAEHLQQDLTVTVASLTVDPKTNL
jgi:hypothetical protein